MRALSNIYLMAGTLFFANILTFATPPALSRVGLAVRGPASHQQLTRTISASGFNPQGHLIRTWTLLKPIVRQTPTCDAQTSQHLFLCPPIGGGFGDRKNPLAHTAKTTPGADFEVIEGRLESLRQLALSERSLRLDEGADPKPFSKSPMAFQEFAAINQVISRNLSGEIPTQ